MQLLVRRCLEKYWTLGLLNIEMESKTVDRMIMICWWLVGRLGELEMTVMCLPESTPLLRRGRPIQTKGEHASDNRSTRTIGDIVGTMISWAI